MSATDRTISNHNWCGFEEVNYDLAKEVLKLKLVYDFISQKGYTSEADYLLGEAVSNIGEYQSSLDLFYKCTSDGRTFNPD